MNYQTHRVGAVILKNRKVLMARDKDEDYFKSPGGILEPNETPHQAIIRELKEELGIKTSAKNLEFFGTFFVPARDNQQKTVRMDAIIVKDWTGEFRPSDDVEELAWIDSKALGRKKLGHVFQDYVIPSLKDKGIID